MRDCEPNILRKLSSFLVKESLAVLPLSWPRFRPPPTGLAQCHDQSNVGQRCASVSRYSLLERKPNAAVWSFDRLRTGAPILPPDTRSLLR